jgi:hypothetical protein
MAKEILPAVREARLLKVHESGDGARCEHDISNEVIRQLGRDLVDRQMAGFCPLAARLSIRLPLISICLYEVRIGVANKSKRERA